MTKEELTKRVAVLETYLREAEDENLDIRKDFARIFCWYKEGTYSRDKEIQVPTLAQIFAEVGRLQAAKTFLDLEGNVSELESAAERFNRYIDQQTE